MKKRLFLALVLLVTLCMGCGNSSQEKSRETSKEKEHEHVWEAADCESAKTCKECGETEGKAAGHDWQEASCTEAKLCSVCGKKDGEANGHMYTEASCVAPGKCSVCGVESGEPVGHSPEFVGECEVCHEILNKELVEDIYANLEEGNNYLITAIQATAIEFQNSLNGEETKWLFGEGEESYSEEDAVEMLGAIDIITLEDFAKWLETKVYEAFYDSQMENYRAALLYYDEVYKLCGESAQLAELKAAVQLTQDFIPLSSPTGEGNLYEEYKISFADFAKMESSEQSVLMEALIEKFTEQCMNAVSEEFTRLGEKAAACAEEYEKVAALVGLTYENGTETE